MAEQKRQTHVKRPPAQDDDPRSGRSEVSRKGEELKEALDTLLDELDDLLEENAEEFVASYVQRGGQ